MAAFISRAAEPADDGTHTTEPGKQSMVPVPTLLGALWVLPRDVCPAVLIVKSHRAGGALGCESITRYKAFEKILAVLIPLTNIF
ncbi:hypothetical protein [Salinisphaera orenii]|uniref:hypothetical protein n=1 Tax=Salinisphaera orenii TaxID=856731 RepID=UPI0013A61149